ncbi:hypothetical protein DVH24_038774 [Malus domestica]|uniref:Glycolipid transfer protein domain-containing protein n=1 Tax=Malus domestica TaxID=3750 RepID=A0A498K8B4_MALDO|nr:hypothetical protein DVH24_038774 [Malus domestica]
MFELRMHGLKKTLINRFDPNKREPPILTGLLSLSSRVLLAPHSWSSSSPVLLAGPSRWSCSSSSVQFEEPLNRVRTSIFACPVVRCYFHLFSPFIFAASFYYLMLAFVIMEKIGSSLSLSCGYMDFLVELFRNLREHPLDWVTIRAVYNAYAKTLIKWHDEKIILTLIPLHLFGDLGLFLGSKYAPEKDLLLKVIGGNGDVMGDMEKFCTSLLLYLNRITSFCLVAKVPSTYPKQRKMGKTMFAPALEELESVKSESKEIMTKHFLESCNKILPIIAEFGNVVYPVTFDIRTCVVVRCYFHVFSLFPFIFCFESHTFYFCNFALIRTLCIVQLGHGNANLNSLHPYAQNILWLLCM